MPLDPGSSDANATGWVGTLVCWALFGDGDRVTLEKLYTVHTPWEFIEGHFDLGIRDDFLEEMLQAGPNR